MQLRSEAGLGQDEIGRPQQQQLARRREAIRRNGRAARRVKQGAVAGRGVWGLDVHMMHCTVHAKMLWGVTWGGSEAPRRGEHTVEERPMTIPRYLAVAGLSCASCASEYAGLVRGPAMAGPTVQSGRTRRSLPPSPPCTPSAALGVWQVDGSASAELRRCWWPTRIRLVSDSSDVVFNATVGQSLIGLPFAMEADL